MAYRLVKNRTFTCTATLMVPTDDGPRPETVTVRYRVLEGAEQLQIEDFLRAAILHLGDILDDDGEQVAFSPALLEQILLQPWARVGLLKAYWTEMARGQVRAKN